MNRTSRSTALTATSIGMAMLLAACGATGSDSAASAPRSAATTLDSAGQVQSPQTSSATSTQAPTSTTPQAAPSDAQPTTSAPASAGDGQQNPSTTSDKPVPRCTVDQLKLSVGTGNADMQGAHRPLRFTNISTTVCKLTGAPGVSYVAGDDGHQVGKPARRHIGHQPVVLIPNATASAGLFLSSAPRKSDCQLVDVRGLRVYPPDSYRAAFLPLPEVTCKPPQSRTFLEVGPILPGPNNTGV